jgi:hypothetical protein
MVMALEDVAHSQDFYCHLKTGEDFAELFLDSFFGVLVYFFNVLPEKFQAV